MAQRRRGGYRAPSNYEPGRKPRSRKRWSGSGQSEQGQRAQQPGSREPGSREPGARAAQASTEPASTGRAPQQASERVPERRKKRVDDQPAEVVFERITSQLTTAADTVGVGFSDLGLGGNIVRVLSELGAERPFAIQVATIPDAVAGRNVLGRARTGSGKTIAFGAAVVERLLRLKSEGAFARDPDRPKGAVKRGVRAPQRARRNPKALILAPTRELALQIDRTVQPIARSVGFYTAQLVGGVPIDSQLHALARGADIVIGTPGRIQDLVNRGKLELREVLVSVIDEADHMSDLGFLEPVQRLLRQTDRRGQRLLFSATLDASVQQLVAEFLRSPAAHEVEESSGTVGHRVFLVLREDKQAALTEFAAAPGRKLIFCRTRAYAEQVGVFLAEAGLRVTTLHGDLTQSRRERNLERFASGKVDLLVATDVAARGIHVEDIDVVLQADPPDDFKTYLHRAGRTGRAGRDGSVVTLIPRTRQKRTREMLALAEIEPDFFGDYVAGSGAAS